jgi:CheY-like chemotaxis protein
MPRLLLVEDNEMNRDMLTRRLERRGYEVLCAHDGESGIARAMFDKPDLILMDMSLPILDGWEATKRLKADAQTEHIPVIALTAHAMSSDRTRALAVGCDDYATKPVEFAKLLQKIENWLQRTGIQWADVQSHKSNSESTFASTDSINASTVTPTNSFASSEFTPSEMTDPINATSQQSSPTSTP